MFKQTEEKYKGINLGFGSGSIYDFGCYLTSLVNGLKQKGYSYTPESFNELLKSKNAFIGSYKNYIDVTNLNNYLPDTFKSFQQIEPWNDVPSTQDLLKDNLIVVCKVDARAIGGSGTHFVLLTGIKDNVAVIYDPWKGVEEKITVRWGKYGNIQGVRVFKVAKYVSIPQTPSSVDLGGLQTALETYGIISIETLKSKLVAKDSYIKNHPEVLSSPIPVTITDGPIVPPFHPEVPEAPNVPSSDNSFAVLFSAFVTFIKGLLGKKTDK